MLESFTEKCDMFNDDYRSVSNDKKQEGIRSIKYYYTPKDLTSDMKKFLQNGLQLLTYENILTEFESKVFYLHEVEKKKQGEIVSITNSTIDKVKKTIPRVRKKLAERSNTVKYIFFMDSQGDNDDIDEEADRITERKYGEDPTEQARIAEREYLEELCKEYKQTQNSTNDLSSGNRLKTIRNNSIYQTLVEKVEQLEDSTKYKEWCEKRYKEYERLYAKKLGCTVKEIKKREEECGVLEDSIYENCNLLGNNDEMFFKLWGYMQIYWLKLDKYYVE